MIYDDLNLFHYIRNQQKQFFYDHFNYRTSVTEVKCNHFKKKMFIFLLTSIVTSQFVTYGSAVQLKGLFTKNRITIEINQTSLLPVINCKRPPYNDGWYWVIEPANGTQEVTRKPIICGEDITLHNPLFSYYITSGERSQRMITATKLMNQEGKSHWKVICDQGTKYWEQDKAVQFYNVKEKCYLQSGFNSITNEVENQIYEVKCAKKFSKETQWRSSEGIYLDNEPISEMYAKSPRN